MIDEISRTPAIHDVVLSGGDCFLLEPEQLAWLGEKLLGISHVKRIRIATRGLSSNPGRFLDEDDAWFAAVKWVSDEGRMMGKVSDTP
jgi:lysine 2,3-aminomutase